MADKYYNGNGGPWDTDTDWGSYFGDTEVIGRPSEGDNVIFTSGSLPNQAPSSGVILGNFTVPAAMSGSLPYDMSTNGLVKVNGTFTFPGSRVGDNVSVTMRGIAFGPEASVVLIDQLPPAASGGGGPLGGPAISF